MTAADVLRVPGSKSPCEERARLPLPLRRVTLFVLTALFCHSLYLPAMAKEPDSAGDSRSVIIVIDKLGFEDLASFPEATEPLSALAKEGAVGMMNVRTAAGANSPNGYLSLGTGRRTAGGRWSGRALEPRETIEGHRADAIYQGITGQEPTGEVMHLGIGELGQISQAFGARPGMLGEALKDHDLTPAVLGNSDVLGETHRFGALLVMDHAGIVPIGTIDGDLLVSDPSWPGGKRTNYPKTLATLLDTLDRADVVVVDLGDLARLEAYEPYLDEKRSESLRVTAIQRMSGAVRDIVQDLDGPSIPPTTVYLISPSPTISLGRPGILITPAFRRRLGSGQSKAAGLLTSASTRRPGIVTNADFLPTVLSDLKATPPQGTPGRPWNVEAHPDPLSFALSQYQAIKSVHQLRLPVIQPYFLVVLGLIAVGASLTVLVHQGVLGWSFTWDTIWRYLLTTFLAFPAGLLLLALLPPANLATTWFRLAAITASLSAFATLLGRGRRLGPAGIIASVTTVLLIADIVAGAPMMKNSLLGYDPVSGSRYYGIGNEYMGTLIGAALVSGAFGLEALRPRGRGTTLPAYLLALIALILAHPGLGINVGGAITAAFAAGAVLLFAAGRRVTWRWGLGWSLGIILLVLAAGLLDSFLSQSDASHLGRVVQRVGESGADPLWSVFERKLAVNIKLIRLTIWSRVVLASFGLLGIILFWPNWLAASMRAKNPWLLRMTKASLIAASVALAVNDSGVVAASTLLVWPALTVLSLSVPIEPPPRSP